MSGSTNVLNKNNIRYDDDVVILQKKVKSIIKTVSAFLNTSEMNIVEYLKNDQLLFEIFEEKKRRNNLNYNNIDKIDETIEWLDDIWFGLKLEERLSLVYYLY